MTVADFEHQDTGRSTTLDGERFAARWMADVDGRLIGFARAVHQWQRTDGTTFDIEVEVMPTHRRQGVGQALYAAMLDALAAKAPFSLEAETMEDQPDAVAWLQRRGFEQTIREPMSALAVQGKDLSLLGNSAEIAAAANVTIKTLSQLATSDTSYKPKLFDLAWEVVKDVPGANAENRERPDNDYLENMFMGDPSFTPDAWFIAVDNVSNDFVGFCYIAPGGLDGHWGTGLTGVLRSHRRKRLATALKLCSIQYVIDHGGIEIETSNEENNPMYDLNIQLGFEPRPAALGFTRS